MIVQVRVLPVGEKGQSHGKCARMAQCKLYFPHRFFPTFCCGYAFFYQCIFVLLARAKRGTYFVNCMSRYLVFPIFFPILALTCFSHSSSVKIPLYLTTNTRNQGSTPQCLCGSAFSSTVFSVAAQLTVSHVFSHTHKGKVLSNAPQWKYVELSHTRAVRERLERRRVSF